MKLSRLLPPIVVALTPAFAQLTPPNPVGVALGHIQLTVKDVDVQLRFWTERMGGVGVKHGALDMIRFPGVYIVLRKGNARGPPAGSIVNHFGLVYKDLPVWIANWKASGIEIEQAGNPLQGYVHAPDGVRVEFFGDPSIDATVKMDHIHFYPLETEEIKDWYTKAFGGQPGQRPRVATPGWTPCVFFPGANFSFTRQDSRMAPTAGRSLDHVGLEVKNLDLFVKKLEERGIRMDERPHAEKDTKGLRVAYLTDPWGTRIELTEGLGKQK
jgi:catechol 2,3-dioxygenase-like lactoylglutathione lyase family enzyme